jgi:Asp-tRNA(Asn)/Glu-tRNA(Gln) amidotransferase C subunit
MRYLIITTIADGFLRVGAGILALLLMILMIVLVFWIPFKAIQRDLKRGPKAFMHTGTFTYIVMFVGMGGFFAIVMYGQRFFNSQSAKEQAPLIFISILYLIVFITIYIVISYKASKRADKLRIDQIKKIANLLKLSFSDEGNQSIIKGLSEFHLFSQGSSKEITNMIHGNYRNQEFALFDYKYVVEGSEGSSSYKQSVIWFHSENLCLPNFALRPENLFHKIGGVLGYQDIDFESHPKFSKTFLLRGNDEAKIRDIFKNEVLNFFESLEEISVEGGDNQLILYRHQVRIAPEELEQFMDEGFQVFEQFHGSA